MKLPAPLALAALALAACGGATEPTRAPEPPPSTMSTPDRPPSTPPRPAYPTTRSEATADELFGTAVPDPYRWLEDAASPEVDAWVRAQDELARAKLGALPERDVIASRLKELLYVDAVSAPVHRKGRYFFTRRHADREKAVVYFREGRAGEERVLLDPNAWSDDGSVSLGEWVPSWDGKRVAYKVRKNNSDEATLHVMEVGTGERSKVDVIDGAKYARPAWTPSGDGFYYTFLPSGPSIPVADRPGFAEVRFHKLGDDPRNDTLVRERTGDARTFIDADLSRDGRWLVLSVHHGWTSSDVYVRDLRAGKESAWRPLAVGTNSHYGVEVHRGSFYVHTDDGAPRWRVLEVDPKKLERSAWKEIVPERADATLSGASIVGGKLVLNYLEDARSQLEVRGLDGKLVRKVELPGLGTVNGPVGLADEDEAFFAFESYTVPQEIYSTSIATGKTERYARVSVPIDPEPFVTEQLFATSKDGTRVSMFVVRRKDMPRDGTARAILYGYGGFQINLTPSFAGSIYPWLERGGVYVVANLRGGAEYGEEWHRSGMLLEKQNVFDDFIAAAEHLVKEGYTRPERLAIRGGSNGGLLVGAAITQRPDLFGAALCAVPLLDMVRYHLFGSGKTWISEYGSADEVEQFRALFAYSPYHRVRPETRYPAVLLLSADSDDRVDPLHARKFAAALQGASTGGPVLLRIERKAGHGGADLVKSTVEQMADQLAFALEHTGPR